MVVTDEPIEFENYLVEVEDCRKITHHLEESIECASI